MISEVPTRRQVAALLAAGVPRAEIARRQGEPITLALHHINGERHDNRLENLRLLCPNCHSQTHNCAGRNSRGRERAAE